MIDARRLWTAVLMQAINGLTHANLDLRGYSRVRVQSFCRDWSNLIPAYRFVFNVRRAIPV
jgi:hypothetical protein